MTEPGSDAMGAILAAMLNPPTADGPPFVHDLTPRPCVPCGDRSGETECHDGPLYRYLEANDFRAEYARRCGCGCHLPQLAYTVTTLE